MLLDELGTGTDPVEGAALAIAMVRSFCDSGLKGGGFGGSRLLVATTHHGTYCCPPGDTGFAAFAALVVGAFASGRCPGPVLRQVRCCA